MFVDGPQDTKSEDDHKDNREHGEGDVNSEHVEDKDEELEEVADHVGDLPGDYINDDHWVHGTLEEEGYS